MTEHPSKPASRPTDTDTGTCVQQWDGHQWENLSGNYYCVPPYVAQPSDHLPHGDPGVVGSPMSFPCVSPEIERSAAGGLDRGKSADPAPRHKATAVCSPAAPLTPSLLKHPPVSKFNLIYHVCANAANDIWLRNVRQLRRRLGTFNGRKVVAIATGPGLVQPDDVQAVFAWPGVEYLLVPNDAEIGHTASFPALLAAVRSKNAHEATFYAHTKGVSNRSQDPKAIEYWRNAMYASLLDDLSKLQEGLRGFAGLGACKLVHPGLRAFPSKIPWGHWHFAGTFFWFRHDRIFNDFRHTFVPHDYYGVEAWLGGFLAPEEACSLLQPRSETDQTWTGYDRGVWTDPIADEMPSASRQGPRISVVIPCKGRLSHLRHVLPYWLKQATRPEEILVVDYGCPERCGDWVNAAYPEVRVVRACHNVEQYNGSRARNIGAVSAAGDYLAFVDADFIAPPDYLTRVTREILAGHDLVCIAHYDHGELGLNGTCTVSADLYRRIRGYDESHPTYGFEDTDFYRR
ncbi:MAG: glycosyltransferase family A protein, partial [Thermoguttaceae bacterium]